MRGVGRNGGCWAPSAQVVGRVSDKEQPAEPESLGHDAQTPKNEPDTPGRRRADEQQIRVITKSPTGQCCQRLHKPHIKHLLRCEMTWKWAFLKLITQRLGTERKAQTPPSREVDKRRIPGLRRSGPSQLVQQTSLATHTGFRWLAFHAMHAFGTLCLSRLAFPRDYPLTPSLSWLPLGQAEFSLRSAVSCRLLSSVTLSGSPGRAFDRNMTDTLELPWANEPPLISLLQSSTWKL